jgi:hypothetical protein
MRDQKWKKRTELEIGGERTIKRGKKHQICVKYQKVGDWSLAKFNYRRPIRCQSWSGSIRKDIRNGRRGQNWRLEEKGLLEEEKNTKFE